MSNTYFKMSKKVTNKGIEPQHTYTNTHILTLTAFVGHEDHTQLTVQTQSSLMAQGGVAYVVLGDKEVDLLIAGLLERKFGKISATGYEKSIFSPEEPD